MFSYQLTFLEMAIKERRAQALSLSLLSGHYVSCSIPLRLPYHNEFNEINPSSLKNKKQWAESYRAM
jgi:hypothetical protein